MTSRTPADYCLTSHFGSMNIKPDKMTCSRTNNRISSGSFCSILSTSPITQRLQIGIKREIEGLPSETVSNIRCIGLLATDFCSTGLWLTRSGANWPSAILRPRKTRSRQPNILNHSTCSGQVETIIMNSPCLEYNRLPAENQVRYDSV